METDRCLNCGSKHFNKGMLGAQCKICGTRVKSRKPNNTYAHFYVTKGPKIIASLHGIYGFKLAPGKYAIVRKGRMSNGEFGEIQQFNIVFDDAKVAEGIANRLAMKITPVVEAEVVEDSYPLLGDDAKINNKL